MAQSVERLTAEQLRKRANILAEGDAAYTARSVDDVTQTIDDRPDVGTLYKKLDILNRKPLDYGGITRVNKARGEQGDREWLGGLAMQMLGGKTIAPAGKHVFEKALEKQNSIRPNAADVGWTNPETGDFEANPQTTRNQEEKLITGRIDALIKEQEAKAKIAIAAGNAEDAQVAKQNAEVMKQIMATIALQNSNNRAVQIQIGGDKAGTGAGTKPLQHSEQRDLTAIADSYRNLNQTHTSFKDEYAGGLGGTPGQEIMNTIATNFPEAMKLNPFTSKKTDAAQIEKSAWWATQKRLDEMVERHTLFGAALTAAEVASWKAASIQPGMTAKQIKDNMVLRESIIKQKAEQARNMHLENGKIPGAVNAALKNVPMGEFIRETPGVTATPAGGDAEFEALQKKHPKR